MDRKKYLDEIIELLTFVAHKVKFNNSLNLTDINIVSENFFRDLLNNVYKFNLKNLNSVKQNISGIDLVDESKGIAFQVTSDKKKEKIKDTIRSFVKKGLNKKHHLLKIFIIGEKPKFRSDKNTLEENEFVLDLKEDVWDISKLLRDINDKLLDEIRDIHSFLKKEISFPLSEDKTWVEKKEISSRASRILKTFNIEVDNQILGTAEFDLNAFKQKHKKLINMKKKVINLFNKLRYRDNLRPIPRTEVKLDSQKIVMRSTAKDDYPNFDSQGDIDAACVVPFIGYYDRGQDCGIEVATSYYQEVFIEKNTGRWFLDDPVIKSKIPEWKTWQIQLVFQCAKLSYSSIEYIDSEIDDYQYGPRFFCAYKNTKPPLIPNSVRYIFPYGDSEVMAPLEKEKKICLDKNGQLFSEKL